MKKFRYLSMAVGALVSVGCGQGALPEEAQAATGTDQAAITSGECHGTYWELCQLGSSDPYDCYFRLTEALCQGLS